MKVSLISFIFEAVVSTLTAPPSLLGAEFLVNIECSIIQLLPVTSTAPPSPSVT